MVNGLTNDRISFEAYGDFLCSHTYQAAVWLRKVREVQGERLQVNWRNFALEQLRSKEGPEWRVWDQPDEYPSRGMPAFRAAEAARFQGPEAYERMRFALLEGRHERRKDFRDPDDIEEIARTAGLDIPRFKRDLADRSLMKRVAEDHVYGVSEYGIFGTPTFVFPNGRVFFVRIKAPESGQEAARLFDGLQALFIDMPYFDEVKHAHKPRVPAAAEGGAPAQGQQARPR